jgi:hypothetical protein
MSINLGTAGSFAVLAGSTVTNTGATVITGGNVGVSPGTSITGFPPGIVVPPSTIHIADGVASQAQTDLTAAYTQSTPSGTNISELYLGTLTLLPGVYTFTSNAQLTGTLTLDAQNNPGAVFIFNIGTTLITAPSSSVVFINGSTCNVFWRVGSSATIDTNTSFVGNILALTSITVNSGATVNPGRLLARNGAVTLNNNIITVPLCGTTTITNVSPNIGLTTGGTLVTITGSGFTGTSSVSFGGIPAASFTVVNDNTIIAVSPPQAQGASVITVTTPSGIFVAPMFVFVPPIPVPGPGAGPIPVILQNYLAYRQCCPPPCCPPVCCVPQYCRPKCSRY